jgi:hypothetical protein
MTKQIIYVVTSGSYSDYGIEAIYQTREDAQRLVELLNRSGRYGRDHAVIEEHELLPPGDTSIKLREQWHAHALIDSDGKITVDEQRVHCDVDIRNEFDDIISDHPYGTSSTRAVNAIAHTREGAMKAVRERAAQLATEIIEGRA